MATEPSGPVVKKEEPLEAAEDEQEAMEALVPEKRSHSTLQDVDNSESPRAKQQRTNSTDFPSRSQESRSANEKPKSVTEVEKPKFAPIIAPPSDSSSTPKSNNKNDRRKTGKAGSRRSGKRRNK